MLVVGTRPEGIKMMPVYFALKRAGLPVVVCSTGQHDHLLQEVFDMFGVVPDITLSLMRPDQTISYLTTAVLTQMEAIYQKYQPSLVLVQGDTTTVMAAALAAYYQKIPVGHVEAGLRTGDLFRPYPEEANRCIVGVLAQYHFAPTAYATGVLLGEGKSRESVFCVGNTVVDALHDVIKKIDRKELSVSPKFADLVADADARGLKKILLTVHRRESFGAGLTSILSAVIAFAIKHPDTLIFYPRHPNPAITKALAELGVHEQKNITIFEPLVYHELVFLLKSVDCVMTDSGGIQEEAVSLGKPVLVLREKTERMEAVWEGCAQLVGTHQETICTMLEQHLFGTNSKEKKESSIYGDGHAGERIVEILKTVVLEKGRSMLYDHSKVMPMEKRMRV